MIEFEDNSSIMLVNHASCVIRDDEVAILSDPWFFGGAFNDGWSLLYQNSEDDILAIIKDITHIWISHEHPDHFSVPFFIKYADILNDNNVEVLFQETKDQRVMSFLRSKNITVRELKNKERYHLSSKLSIKCIKSFFYDSALEIKIGSKKILNLNDCPIVKPQEIESFRKEFGHYEILLTQFSYAAWKGGRDNVEWRKSAAMEKINAMKNQSEILGVKHLIPFASFIRFSNHMNDYLNDQINRPKHIVKEFSNENIEVIFLEPLVKHKLNELKPGNEAIDFWEDQFNKIQDAELSRYPKIFEDDLNASFKKYRSRIFENNSKYIISLISKLPLGVFKKVSFKLTDLKTFVEVDIMSDDLAFSKNMENYDIELDSSSLEHKKSSI